jgi:hypothetical protein
VAKKQAKQKKKASRLTSSLRQHKQVGKSLISPMLTLPGIASQPWTNDRLPQMLWACLVISVLPRQDALAAFREIASIGLRYRDAAGTGDWTLFHSHLPTLPTEILNHITRVITRHPLGYAALRPLLLFDSLPGREQWAHALEVQTQDRDWRTLRDAVLKVLGHQSQEATDIRWLSLLFKLALGLLQFPVTMKERVEELIAYPNKGDMQSVRPFIRAGEMTLAMHITSDNSWGEAFWKECLDKTTCTPAGPPRPPDPEYDRVGSIKVVQQVYMALLDHWFNTLDTTAVDSKHDSAFVLYT